MIELKDVKRTFQDGAFSLDVLKGVNWKIEKGDSIALTGKSGCGKSTLLNLMGGLDRNFSGQISVFGQSIQQLSERELALFRNKQVGFIFQSFHLMDSLSCIDNVLLPTWFGEQVSDKTHRAYELLEKVGLSHKAMQKPHRLSGGERQRVAIARALIQSPSLLLCDEPTGNLDDATGEEILLLFQTLQKEEQLTLLLVTHEERTAQIANKVYQMKNGLVVEGSAMSSSSTEEIQA